MKPKDWFIAGAFVISGLLLLVLAAVGMGLGSGSMGFMMPRYMFVPWLALCVSSGMVLSLSVWGISKVVALTVMKPACPACGKHVRAMWKVCPNCGGSLLAVKAPDE